MNLPQFARKKTGLEVEIDRVIDRMSRIKPEDPMYLDSANHLKVLYEIKAIEAKRSISPDTWAAVGANLLGILLILNYERLGIITTKALTFVAKGRI